MSTRFDEVAVFSIDLRVGAGDLPRLESMLLRDERERACRFVFPEHRRRYVAAHAALRTILARYTGRAPDALQFVTNAYGKPRLVCDDAIRFNLSHSHDRAVVAVTRGAELGVDVEYVRRSVDFDAIVERFWSAEERIAFRELPAHERPLAFFIGWTRKEAFVKACGDGLSRALDGFSVSLDPSSRCMVSDGRQRWLLLPLSVDDVDYVGTIAVPSAMRLCFIASTAAETAILPSRGSENVEDC